MRFAILVLGASSLFGADLSGVDSAFALYNRTDYRAAIHLLRSVPEDARVLELMGRAHFMLGDFHHASDLLDRAAALNPNSSTIQMWRGRAYGRRAETAFAVSALGYAIKSREAFEKAVELDNNNTEAVNDLLEFYVEAPGIVGGGVDKAHRLIPLIAKRDPAESHFASAKLAEHRKDYTAAESHLRKAMELAPREVGRSLDLAQFFARRGRFDESDKVFDQADKMAPDAPKVLYARAEAYVENKHNVDRAKELLKRYLAASNLSPDDPPRSEANKLLKRAEGG